MGEELTSIDQIDGARLLEVMSDCVDPVDAFQRFAEAADTLEDWYAHDRVGSRPPGRLRRLPDPRLPWPRQLIAAAGYRLLHDPDARTWRMRLRKQF